MSNADRPSRLSLVSAGPLTPPHSLEAEAAVISAVILDPTAIDQVADILRAEQFYAEAHRQIYEACIAISLRGSPIDAVSVGTELRDTDRLAQVGGMAYLTEVLNASPAVANVRSHAKIVVETWTARQVIRICKQYEIRGYGVFGAAQEYVGALAGEIHEIACHGHQPTGSMLHPLVVESFKKLQAAVSRGGVSGLSTGFDRLDRLTAGMHDGDLTIVAARPGLGKTSLAINIAVNVAAVVTGGKCCTMAAVFSLEMPREQLTTRMLCSEGRVDSARIRTSMLAPSDWDKLTRAAQRISDLPIWIDDQSAISIVELRAKVRRLQSEFDRTDPETGEITQRLGLVVVDYLQLMKGSGAHDQNREQEVSEISRGLKAIAKEMKLPVIALSQLNRQVETRGDKKKRPQLSDLRECVTGDQVVVDAITGARVTVRELAEGGRVVTYGLTEAMEVGRAPVARAWSTGVKPVFLVTTVRGLSIRCTANHPLRGVSGWQPIEDMAIADHIAVIVDGCAGWDQIASVVSDGKEETFDLLVPGLGNFVVGGVVAHNSGAIEQDADNIIFIYRDDYYDKDTEDRGIAELIIAKQRNGPTDTVKVKFDAQYTRFDNLPDGQSAEDDRY